jgi:hypothetical protein
MVRRRLLVFLVVAALAWVGAVAGAGPGPASASGPEVKARATKPDKVVIIVVDALSRRIVEKYDMKNVQRLMARGVDSPRGYLGHTGSVTVVTHNVITSGLLPKNMGWTSEGYRDVDGVLGPEGGFYITSNFGHSEMSALQTHAGYPHLSDYLDDSGKVFTVSPKGYAAYGLAGPGSPDTSVVTFTSGPTCEGQRYRMPTGVPAPPAYIGAECGSRYLVERDKGYDTLQFPAQLYPATDDRYVVGDEPAHEGGDVWATDAVLDIMEHEQDAWSGIFVSLPGVDKAAHMWGGVRDPEEATTGYDAMTHMRYAAATADAQVGRIMKALRESGELDSTLVVLTADHGSVAAAPGHWHGDFEPENDYGYFNWYYGDAENDVPYDRPQEALQPLVDTGKVGLSYSDSMLSVWLNDQSPATVSTVAKVMRKLPDVTAVWRRDGDHFTRVTRVRRDRMPSKAERAWFDRKAQGLLDTQAADYGPDLVATLPDHTTYSVLGDHGGIQRASQRIPIVFAGADLSRQDLRAEVRSVDIMPTILRAMGIAPTFMMDGKAYKLPRK